MTETSLNEIATGVLLDFVKWLSLRNKRTIFSSHDYAGCTSDLIEEFLSSKNIKYQYPKQNWTIRKGVNE